MGEWYRRTPPHPPSDRGSGPLPRMGAGGTGLVDGPEALCGDLRVHLGCRETRVAEHLLDDAQIGSMVEEVRCARVPEHVRRDPILEPHSCRGGSHDPPASLARESATTCVEEDR